MQRVNSFSSGQCCFGCSTHFSPSRTNARDKPARTQTSTRRTTRRTRECARARSDRIAAPSHMNEGERADGIPVTFGPFGTRGILASHTLGADRSRGVDIASGCVVPEQMWLAHAGARKLASRHSAAVRGRRMRALRTPTGRAYASQWVRGWANKQPGSRKALCVGVAPLCTHVRWWALPSRCQSESACRAQPALDHARRCFGCDVHYGMRRGGLRIVTERRCSYPAEGVRHARRVWCPVGS